MELSKKDKKVAREIIEKGVQREFANGLNAANAVIQKWKSNHLTNREAYHLLFKKITDFDKHIAHRYDAMRGSRYFITIANLFAEEIITEEDIKDFSQEVIEELYRIKNFGNSNSSE